MTCDSGHLFLWFVVLLVGQLCLAAEPPATPLVVSIEGVRNGELEFTLKNEGDKRLTLIDKMEHGYGVIKVKITQADGSEFQLPRMGIDWTATPDDLVTISPKDSLKRTMKIPNIRSGEYKIEVTYEVDRDSFYLIGWFNGSLRDVDEADKMRMTKGVWLGRATSGGKAISYKDGSKDNPVEEQRPAPPSNQQPPPPSPPPVRDGG